LRHSHSPLTACVKATRGKTPPDSKVGNEHWPFYRETAELGSADQPSFAAAHARRSVRQLVSPSFSYGRILFAAFNITPASLSSIAFHKPTYQYQSGQLPRCPFRVSRQTSRKCEGVPHWYHTYFFSEVNQKTLGKRPDHNTFCTC